MKKLLLLVMIFPLFFACKHNTTSNTPQEPEPTPGCSSECNYGQICVNGECVPEKPLGTFMCSSDGTKSMVMTETGWHISNICPNGCSGGYCVDIECGDGMCNGEETCETCPSDCPPSPPACYSDSECVGGMHCDTTSGHCVSD